MSERRKASPPVDGLTCSFGFVGKCIIVSFLKSLQLVPKSGQWMLDGRYGAAKLTLAWFFRRLTAHSNKG